MIPKTIIHLLSGGLDSVTMLYDLKGKGHNIHCLLIGYAQPHESELWFAEWHCQRLGIFYTCLDIPKLGGLTSESWVVPNRNAIFLSFAVNAAIRAGADTVTIGCNADDEAMFPDCRKSFLDAMNASVKAAGYDIEICAPYLTRKKWEILQLARDMGVPSDKIWTCYAGGPEPCGKCPACQKLKDAERHPVKV